MKTISYFLLIGLFVTAIPLNAQVYNMNPDPNGNPWYTGDAVAPTPELLPHTYEFIPTPASLAFTLPTSVYNDEKPFFSYIKQQEGASCVQVACKLQKFGTRLTMKLIESIIEKRDHQ